MNQQTHIYLLPLYANKDNMRENRSADEHSSFVKYDKEGKIIRVSETNSLIKDAYSMNIHAGQITLVGNQAREAMIHHHPQGHPDRHLQFRLTAGQKTLRIMLPLLDRADYERCIKGFIYIAKEIAEYEKEEFNIQENVVDYLFNERIEELKAEKQFLLGKVELAKNQNGFLNDKDEPLSPAEIEALKEEKHLLPFLSEKR